MNIPGQGVHWLVDMPQPWGESWKARAREREETVQARTVGITDLGAERVVADKAGTYWPHLEGLAPWFLRNRIVKILTNSLIIRSKPLYGVTRLPLLQDIGIFQGCRCRLDRANMRETHQAAEIVDDPL
jgi:hypothetical protein